MISYNFAHAEARYKVVAESMGLNIKGLSSLQIKQALVNDIVNLKNEVGITGQLASDKVLQGCCNVAANMLGADGIALHKPFDLAGDTESLGYSVNLDYRHANLWGVSNLNFNSEFRFLSSDLQTDDPLDLDIGFDSETRLSYWRNRLRYSIGLLRLQGIVTVREVNGDLVAGITLTVRRHFGN